MSRPKWPPFGQNLLLSNSRIRSLIFSGVFLVSSFIFDAVEAEIVAQDLQHNSHCCPQA